MVVFVKSQFSAALATAFDILVTIILVELFNIWYVIAVAIGALCGAIGNFLLGRHWSFAASNDIWQRQMSRYGLVAGGSLVLNTTGVYLLTDGIGIPYLTSKILIAVLITVSFNYPLHRYFVFAQREV